jgi:hypothetical protein
VLTRAFCVANSHAYVEFADAAAVANAIMLNDSLFKGRQLKVRLMKENETKKVLIICVLLGDRKTNECTGVAARSWVSIFLLFVCSDESVTHERFENARAPLDMQQSCCCRLLVSR